MLFLPHPLPASPLHHARAHRLGLGVSSSGAARRNPRRWKSSKPHLFSKSDSSRTRPRVREVACAALIIAGWGSCSSAVEGLRVGTTREVWSKVGGAGVHRLMAKKETKRSRAVSRCVS